MNPVRSINKKNNHNLKIYKALTRPASNGMNIFKNKGYSLIELLIYISIVTVMAILSVQAILSITRIFREVSSFNSIRGGGVAGVERIIKEVRFASSIDYSGTTLNSSPGRLKLNTTDESGSAKTVEFYVNGDSLNIIDNGTDKGTLIGADVVITNLIFKQSTTSKGMLVKIEMSLKDNRATSSRSANFYGSAVLRGTY